jgi:chromosome segregation ATPase
VDRLRGLEAELEEARAGCRQLEECERELEAVRSEVDRLRGLDDELQVLQARLVTLDAAWQELDILRSELQSSRQAMGELDDLRRENLILIEELSCAQERLEHCLQQLERRPEPSDVTPSVAPSPEQPSPPVVADTVTINLNRSRLLASV